MNSMANKAALGELTLGDLWGLIGEKVSSVRVEDKYGETVFSTIHFSPNVSLGFSNKSADEPDADPEYSFPLGVKVKVRGDHIEIFHDDWFGEKENLLVYLLFDPEPEVIKLDFLLPGGGG